MDYLIDYGWFSLKFRTRVCSRVVYQLKVRNKQLSSLDVISGGDQIPSREIPGISEYGNISSIVSRS